jgi:hypothetical protein
LETKHLLELHDTIVDMPIPKVDRHADFIIRPIDLPPPPPD